MRKLLAVLAVSILVGAFGQVAIADVEEGSFDEDGTISGDGRHVTTTMNVECDEGERYKLRLTVTQDDTGAWAQKNVTGECTGEEEDVSVTASAQGKVGFDTSNDTEACAAVRTRAQHEGVTDAEQFCEDLDELEDTDDDDDDDDDEDDD